MSFGGLPAELIDPAQIRRISPVAGGGIAEAYRVETPDGVVFAKSIHNAPAGLFEREAKGLMALREAGAMPVPQVLTYNESGLVLEWVEVDTRGRHDDVAFGAGLARLHSIRGQRFGSLDEVTRSYVGSVEVDLLPAETWTESFLVGRVLPLARRCVERRRLPGSVLPAIDLLILHGDKIVGPIEPPSLVHGDLWSGNRLRDAAGTPWLIDPSVSWSHRELDFGMMTLFGGFGQVTFEAYNEVLPLADGWRDRLGLHQLLPLLVHVVIFGDPYVGQLQSTLDDLTRGL